MAENWPVAEAIEDGVLTSKEASTVEKAVHDLLGPDQKIVGVEKKVVVKEEEVIMVNGTPIALEGEEGVAIKECLIRGAIPPKDLLNHLLFKVRHRKINIFFEIFEAICCTIIRAGAI